MDLEKSFLPHLVSIESVKKLWEDGVKKEWFFDKNIRSVLDFVFEYYVEEKFQKVPDKELLEYKFPFLTGVLEEETRSLSVLIPDLKIKFQRVSIDNGLKRTAETALKDPQQALQEEAERIMTLQRATASRKRFMNYGETLEDRLDVYFDEVNSGMYRELHKGFPLFWDELTDHTNGILPNELAFLIGSPNSGKSYFLAHQALYAASNKIKTYYASLENPPDMTMKRLDCILSGVSYQRYERGLLNKEETTRLKNATQGIDAYREYLIIDMPTEASERTISELYARARYEGAELFVGDQLDWITISNPKLDHLGHVQKMEFIVPELTYMTRESGLAAIWGAQFNREGSKKEGRKALSDIANSSFIEKNASWVFGISATEEQQATETVVFDIMKTRRSPRAAFYIKFALQNKTALNFLREKDD